MQRKTISTKLAPKAIGPYTQAQLIGNLIFASGQIGLDPESGILACGTENQAKQIFKNIKAVLAEVGADFSNIVKVTIFMINPEEFGLINDLMAQEFSEPYPARSCVFVASLPKGALVEIEVIASL